MNFVDAILGDCRWWTSSAIETINSVSSTMSTFSDFYLYFFVYVSRPWPWIIESLCMWPSGGGSPLISGRGREKKSRALTHAVNSYNKCAWAPPFLQSWIRPWIKIWRERKAKIEKEIKERIRIEEEERALVRAEIAKKRDSNIDYAAFWHTKNANL